MTESQDRPSSPANLSATKRALLKQRLKGRVPTPSVSSPASPLRGERPHRFRASAQQQSVYTAYATSGSSPAFHTVSAFRLNGVPNTTALESSLADLVQRHEVLRSNYRLRGDRVEMTVRDSGRGRFVHQRVARSTTERAAVDAVVEPFDMQTDSLIRLVLLEIDSGESLLVSVAHDIIYDGWSVLIFWRELASLYRSRINAEPHGLDELELQFADIVDEAPEVSVQASGNSLSAFWRDRLTPVPPPISIAGARFCTQHDHHGALSDTATDATLGADLETFAKQRGITPFIVLLLAFMELLARYCQTRDLLVATPIASRAQRGARHLIGQFVSTLPIRHPGSPDASVEMALAQLKEDFLTALDHRDVSMDQLLQLVDVPREPGRLPLVQVMFVYQTGDEGNPDFDLGEIKAVHYRIDPGVSKFDLTLFVTDSPDGLQTLVEFRTSLFDAPAMASFANRFRSLLRSVLAHPDAALKDLDYLSSQDRRRLDRSSRGPTFDCSGHDDVLTQIYRVAATTPDTVAVSSTHGSISYQDLVARARSVSRELLASGVRPGDRVAHFFNRDEHAMVGLLGIMGAGAAYVAIDPVFPAQRRQMVADAAGISTWASVSSLADECAEASATWLAIDRIETHASGEPVRPDLDATAYVIYTSGSSGRPKGISVSHRNLVHSNQARIRYYGVQGQAFLLLSSFAFDSSVAGIFETLTTGGELVIADDSQVRDPRRLRRLIEHRRIHGLLAIPALYREILLADERPLATLARAIVAGEVCDDSVVRLHFLRQPHAALYNEYGPSEATVWATVHRCTPSDALGPVPIGKPIPNTRILILDQHRSVVAPGLPGELYIGGDGVAKGYLEQPGETEQRFVRVPEFGEVRFFRTGDKALWDHQNRLQYLERFDSQVKLRGHRIELSEVESALLDIAGVTAAAAAVRPPADAEVTSDILVAFIVVDDRVPVPNDSTLRRALAERLPNAWVPSRFMQVDALPSLPNGKLDRQRLVKLARSTQRSSQPKPATPATDPGIDDDPLERALAGIWAEVLALDAVSASDNFFDLGGTSFQAIRLFATMELQLGVVLSPSLLLEQPTINELAHTIRTIGSDPPQPGEPSSSARPSAGASSDPLRLEPGATRASGPGPSPLLVGIQRDGARPPIFAVGGIGGYVLGFSDLAKALGRDQPFFGLQPRTFDDGGVPRESIEEIAREFVDECDSVLRTPYILVGVCFGANVVLEMAHQLEREQRRPSLVVVLDPALDELGECATPARSKLGGAIHFLGLRARALADSYREASARSQRIRWFRQKTHSLTQKFRHRDLLIGNRVELRQHRVEAAHLAAASEYQPQPYGGRLLTLLTRDRPIDASRDPRLAWVRRMHANATVVHVPGSDTGQALSRHFAAIAAEIDPYITELEPRAL